MTDDARKSGMDVRDATVLAVFLVQILQLGQGVGVRATLDPKCLECHVVEPSQVLVLVWWYLVGIIIDTAHLFFLPKAAF